MIRRAAGLFDTLSVAVLRNPRKSPLFSPEERVQLLAESVKEIQNVRVMNFDGLTVHLARTLGATVVLRGLRAILDYDYEVQMALMNRQLAGEIETLFMLTASRYSHLSSTLVKQISTLHAPLAEMVPPAVALALEERARRIGEKGGR